MALIRPIPTGTANPDSFSMDLHYNHASTSYNCYLRLTSAHVSVLTAMGYNYVTTTATAKTAISTNSILIISVGTSSDADAVVTFSKT